MTATPLSTAARHSSESSEHWTPQNIVELARETMGAIDLDPASTIEANHRIRANIFHTREYDGFTKDWYGRVFLNPPGGLSDDQQRPVKAKCRETGSCGLPVGHTHEGVEASQKKWWFKLVQEYREGRVPSAVFVCFSVELLQNTQLKTPSGLRIPLDFPICYPSKRVAYLRSDGTVGAQPPHASCIVFLPDRSIETVATQQCGYLNRSIAKFVRNFSALGRVVVPQSMEAL